MNLLLIDPRYTPLFCELGWVTGADILARFNASGAAAGKKTVITSSTLPRAGQEALSVFCKQYRFARPSWRFWFRPSKAKREFDNYQIFEQLGVACVERIAWGESRDWLGRLRHAFIITRAIPNAGTLPEFVQKQCPTRASADSRVLRNNLAGQLAEMTRRIHGAGFCHNDLYWRNILVGWSAAGEPKLWWIDCPRGKFHSPRRSHRARIKDLAALDIWAAKLCCATERLKFIKQYLAIDKLDQRAKTLVRDVVKYRTRRWRNEGRRRSADSLSARREG